MKAMQSLVKIPEIQATMRELSKEMMKVSGAEPASYAHPPEFRVGLGYTGRDSPLLLIEMILRIGSTVSLKPELSMSKVDAFPVCSFKSESTLSNRGSEGPRELG